MKDSERKRMEKILARVSAKISPTKEEASFEKKFAEGLQKKLQEAVGKSAQVKFVGSTARDTGLKGDKDIDLFVSFPQGRERDDIVQQTFAAARKALPAKWEMHYAEHPYLQGMVEGYKVEVIPCYQIREHEKIISAVDRTPLHADYLQKKMNARQKRDVRLLKKLLKAHSMYGAELEIEGFSGLVCEYLVLSRGSLASLVESAAQWKLPAVIDPERKRVQPEEEVELAKRFPAPLVLVDAIDRNRNAAAAVSETNAAKFVALCRSFAEKPLEAFFFSSKPAIPVARIEQALGKRLHVVAVKMQKPRNVVSDILIPQLRRTQKAVARQLEIADFKVFDSAHFSTDSKSFVFLELEDRNAPGIERLEGPPVHLGDQVQRFVEKHAQSGLSRGPFIQGSRVLVEKERQQTDAMELLRQAQKEPAMFGVASHFVQPFRKSELLDGKGLLKEAREDPAVREKLAEYLFREDAFLLREKK